MKYHGNPGKITTHPQKGSYNPMKNNKQKIEMEQEGYIPAVKRIKRLRHPEPIPYEEYEQMVVRGAFDDPHTLKPLNSTNPISNTNI